jgi:hypothetical protein
MSKLEGKSEGEVVGMLVLAKAKDAWVLKWLLEFPFAPKETSEDLVEHVLETLHKENSPHQALIKRERRCVDCAFCVQERPS